MRFVRVRGLHVRTPTAIHCRSFLHIIQPPLFVPRVSPCAYFPFESGEYTLFEACSGALVLPLLWLQNQLAHRTHLLGQNLVSCWQYVFSTGIPGTAYRPSDKEPP